MKPTLSTFLPFFPCLCTSKCLAHVGLSLFDMFGSDTKDKAYHFERVGYVCKNVKSGGGKNNFFVPHSFCGSATTGMMHDENTVHEQGDRQSSLTWCNILFCLFLFIYLFYRREAVLALLGFIPIFSSRTPFGQPLVRKQTVLPLRFSTYAFQ
jgi:hypothetical protein